MLDCCVWRVRFFFLRFDGPAFYNVQFKKAVLFVLFVAHICESDVRDEPVLDRCFSVAGMRLARNVSARVKNWITVKTILLEQDPPYHRKDGGLFLYSPSPTSKDGVLVV